MIHISGHSCTGKSTIFRMLQEQYPGCYFVSYDKQKWLLAGYQRDRDTLTVRQIVYGLFETVCKLGLPILQDFGFLESRDVPEYEQYKKILDQYGYRVVSVMLTAPQEVLVERFRQRVENAKKMGTRISVDNEALFIANLEKKIWIAAEDTLTFDTSVMSAEEICKAIQEKLHEI